MIRLGHAKIKLSDQHVHALNSTIKYPTLVKTAQLAKPQVITLNTKTVDVQTLLETVINEA
jgi:hypothetical protein